MYAHPILEEAISHLIIDGYNVIGTLHKDIEAAREQLITMLIAYRSQRNHTIIIVFDGHKSGSGKEEHSVRGGVRVIYSRLGERADEVIKRIVSQERREWIVVSSDRDIANHAWLMHSIPIPSERFLDIISRKLKKTESHSDEVEDIDEETSSRGPLRGNPRTLSKKEKAVRRALGKL